MSCPLDSFGVIPESDHFNGQCVCFMCTCSRHTCPSVRKSYNLSSAYVSSYKRSYYKHPSTPPPARVRSQYTPNKAKMDLRTTAKSDYQYQSPPVSKHSRPKTASRSYKWQGRSSYDADYPDWGPCDVARTKRSFLPNHATNIHYNCNSTYQAHFAQKHPVSQPHFTHTENLTVKKQPAVEYQSTTKREHKHFQERFSYRVRQKKEEYVPTNFNTSQFKTEVQRNYVPAHLPVPDHHQVVRAKKKSQ